MLEKFRSFSLVHQLSIILSTVIATVFVVLTTLVTQQTSRDFLKTIEHELEKEVYEVGMTFEFFHDSLVNNTNRLGDIFFKLFPGGISVDNSQTLTIGNYTTPVLVNNNQVINGNFSKPDQFTNMTGGTATIFMRVDDDFLRVSTSLRKTNGDRALGTMLGKNHPGYRTLIEGNTYSGPAYLFGRHYMTKYIPFKDNAGKVIGILYVGFDYTKDFEQLKQRIATIKLGETGYFYAIEAKQGKDQGKFLLHPTEDGNNIKNMQGTSGEDLLAELLSKDSGVYHYLIHNKQTGQKDNKLIAFYRIPGWNWVIAAGSYTQEFTRTSVKLRNTLMMLSIISVVIIIGLLYFTLKSKLSPITDICHYMGALGEGNLTVEVEVDTGHYENTKNEIQFLARKVKETIQGLKTLTTRLMESSESMTETMENVAAVIQNVNDNVNTQQSETTMVATAINEMSATSVEVAKSTDSATNQTRNADENAQQGNQVVNNVIDAIKGISTEVKALAEVISLVEQDSESIGSVLGVIQNIAEQTNLLALNAAIEAARAGDQGRGFAVVADEVRTLAQKTTDSTTEIRETIERLQLNTRNAVSTMETGNKKVEESVILAGEAGHALQSITESMSTVTDMNQQIATAAEEQTMVTEDINQRIMSISDIATETANASEAMSQALSDMQKVTDQLQKSIMRFRV